MDSYELVIGDKNYSSWSLRPWFALKAFGIPFGEIRIRLRQPETPQNILLHSPSGKVPALKAGGLVVWDSLAIIEYLAEQHASLNLWPRDPSARALARSASAEMHSGFNVLRTEMPMDLLNSRPAAAIGAALEADIRRVTQIWRECRARFGEAGPYLFGELSAADAMFAPVATRFATYGVDLATYGDDGTAKAYGEALLAAPVMAEWRKGAEEEQAERATAQGE
jgi:glutathione S-transferase